MFFKQNPFALLHKQLYGGFTLSELLIALVLLGIIASLTVPKLLVSLNTKQANTLANDAKLLVSSAYADYAFGNPKPPSSFTLAALLPSLPYAKHLNEAGETVSIDCPPLGTSVALGCSGSHPRVATLNPASTDYVSLRLKNGGVLVLPTSLSLGGRSPLHGLPFVVDYDGKASNRSDSVEFWLYSDGTVRTRQTLVANTVNSGGTFNPVPNADPTFLQH